MKITAFRVGMVFRKVYRASKEEFYEVVEVLSDKLNGYKREAISLGNVRAKNVTVVGVSEINNPKHWKHVEGASIETERETTVLTKIAFNDGTPCKIIDRSVVDVCLTNLSENKEESVFPKRTGPSRAVVEAKTKKDSMPCSPAKEPIDDTGGFVTLTAEFYFRLMSLTYDDLHILGERTKSAITVYRGIHIPPCGGLSTHVHQSELEAFRDGRSLRGIWKLGNRIRAQKPEQVGKGVSPQTIVLRMMKAFYHWGTISEKEALGMNKPLHELPAGDYNEDDARTRAQRKKHLRKKARKNLGRN